jgi:hypothetical membrane protein
MQDIVKTIAQDPRDEKQPLFAFSSRFFLLSILAFFIIAATETYHRNRYGLPGTIYVMGYGSWVYAITWSIVFSPPGAVQNAFKTGWQKTTRKL